MADNWTQVYPKDRWRDPNYHVMDKFSLQGKKGLITGGAGGIGRNTAAAWAEAGADIMLVGRPGSEERMEPLVHQLSTRYPVRVIPCYCDVSDPVQVQALRQTVLDEMGTVDIAHINAGVCMPHDDADVSYSTWQKTMEVDLTGAYLTTQMVHQMMRLHGHGGSIILNASISGFGAKFLGGSPAPSAAYGTAKAGLYQYGRYLAAALAPYGIRVNIISPSNIWSGIHEGVMTKEGHDLILETVPMKRFGCNEEIQGAMLFLASDASAYITGINLFIDGGYSIY